MKYKKMMKFFCMLIILIFLFSYFIEVSGYYEYNLQNKKNLTEEQIKQFEMDVKEGKDIDLNQYLQDSQVDYSNQLTKTTSEISLKLNDYLKNFLSNGFKILEKFFK
ncbi:MAG: hypothetical protein MR598_01230 [Erysipelotrichaceae bacterium]|nr:hypothetical protein [Erysipelotrichaceae bacterium]